MARAVRSKSNRKGSTKKPAAKRIRRGLDETAHVVRRIGRNGKRQTSIVLTDDERLRVNRATALVTLAKLNLTDVWRPIRERYDLPSTVDYDREKGEVRLGDG